GHALRHEELGRFSGPGDHHRSSEDGRRGPEDGGRASFGNGSGGQEQEGADREGGLAPLVGCHRWGGRFAHSFGKMMASVGSAVNMQRALWPHSGTTTAL